MSSAALIPLAAAYKGPEPVDPMQAAGGVYKLQQLAGQVAIQRQMQQENALKIQAAQEDQEDQKTIQALSAKHTKIGPDGKINFDFDNFRADAATQLRYRNVQAIDADHQKMAQAALEYAKGQGEVRKQQMDELDRLHTKTGQELAGVLALPDEQQPSAWGQAKSRITSIALNQDGTPKFQSFDPRQLPDAYPGKDKLMSLAATVGYRDKIIKDASEQAKAEAESSKAAGAKRAQAVSEYRALPVDEDSGVPDAGAVSDLQKKYPGVKLPTDKAGHDALISSMVPEKELPEYQIKKRQAELMTATTPEEASSAIDKLLDPQKYPKENSEAHSAYKSVLQAGGTPEHANAEVLKILGDIRAADKAVAIAKNTAPIRISVAAATQAAKSNASGLDADDYARAGEEYARTGVMPSLGRDSITRAKIVKAGNTWAKDNNLTPRDVIMMRAAYQGDKTSLINFQKRRDQIVSFEQTAQKNLDMFLDLAGKIPDTGVPWINKPIRTLDEKLIGSENMAAVNAARQVANNEIAKVTSGGGLGGVLSDTARKEVSDYNPASATFAQTKAIAKVLKADMANRHQTMDATLNDIKERIGVTPGAVVPPPGGSTAKAAMGGYEIGVRYGGKTYLGGDPKDASNWK